MACPFRFVLPLFVAMLAQPSPSGLVLQSSLPLPPGHQAANQATRESEKVEPPAPSHRTISAAELQQQADELLSLAQQVHTGTQRAAQGLLDKDLKDKLKRIEKLSKKLRDELSL
jgi:flagellar motor protein MotB